MRHPRMPAEAGNSRWKRKLQSAGQPNALASGVSPALKESSTGKFSRSLRTRGPIRASDKGASVTMGLLMLNHPGVTGRKSGNPAIDDPIYTEAEMAERLRVSVFTQRRWRKARKIAFIQLTQRTIGYRRSHGDQLIAEHTVQPTAA